MTDKSIHGAFEQFFGYEMIEPADHDADLQPVRVLLSLDRLGHGWRV